MFALFKDSAATVPYEFIHDVTAFSTSRVFPSSSLFDITINTVTVGYTDVYFGVHLGGMLQ